MSPLVYYELLHIDRMMITAYYLVVFVLQCVLQNCRGEESFENLYKRTLQEWRTQRNWSPWKIYADALTKRLTESQAIQGSKDRKLQIIGGLEEGILVIEKATIGSGEDIKRDVVLSHLYYSYAYVLSQLTEIECHELALDSHTLLIGSETVTYDSVPSKFLCQENAENAVRNAISLVATNKDAEALLQKLTGLESSSVHARKPKEFVAELFDSFADTFDDKLLNGLGYKVPELVGSIAKEIKGHYNYVLDAGCGTGLAGRYLRPLISNDEGIMVGIDASQKMLNIAKECTSNKGCGWKDGAQDVESITPLYDHLLLLDLEDMNLDNTLALFGVPINYGFDLVVAADVLVYFGSLAKLMKVFSEISGPGAVLLFTCERATDEEAPLGWRLLPSGRFAHSKLHVVEAAVEAGYTLVKYQEIVPRMEKGEEVRGHLFAFMLGEKDEL